MGLLRQDGEVESAVAEDDAVLVLASVAAHAMIKTHVPKPPSCFTCATVLVADGGFSFKSNFHT